MEDLLAIKLRPTSLKDVIGQKHLIGEGNGRTLRVYMEFLVDYLDFNDLEIRYSLWSDDDREELLKSTVVSSVTGDTSGIMGCFDKVLVEKEKKKLRQ